MSLNLYLLSQDENETHDTFDSAVVAAENEEDARRIKVGSIGKYGSWCLPEFVEVKYIGIAADGIEAGERICGSFNAG